MKNTALRCIIVLALLTNAVALTRASPLDHPPVDGAGYVNEPEVEPSEYVCPTPDALNIVDLTCSANDDCGGVERWPIRTVAQSTGNVGGEDDPRDWSSVELYRTETLVLTGSNGLVVESGIGCSTSIGSSLYATQNGWYDVKVSSELHAPYSLKHEVFANDALSGTDAGDTKGDAHFISALPRTLDPTRSVTYKGSLPNRENPPIGPEQDRDWYRIGTNLAALSDPTSTQGPAIGLLTVTATIDCNGGDYSLSFYGPDAFVPVSRHAACGAIEHSCITSGVFPVHAVFAAEQGRGTGYEFNADLLPLYLVNLDDGVPRPHLMPEQPFCDLVTPALLQAAGWVPGTHVGFVNADGIVVASTRVN